jgi:glucan phosphoethanolaminetransferase (alkaline phosphatase superfamily)
MLPSLAPLYLVLLLVVVNYWTTVMHVQSGTKDEKKDKRGDYFSATVGIVLAAVILLPAILDSLQLQSVFNFNDTLFLIWLFGLGLSSIPYRVPALCGIGCLGLAGASPFAVFLYFKWEENKLRKEMKKEVFVTVPKSRKRPRVSVAVLLFSIVGKVAFLTLFGISTRVVRLYSTTGSPPPHLSAPVSLVELAL